MSAQGVEGIHFVLMCFTLSHIIVLNLINFVNNNRTTPHGLPGFICVCYRFL